MCVWYSREKHTQCMYAALHFIKWFKPPTILSQRWVKELLWKILDDMGDLYYTAYKCWNWSPTDLTCPECTN